MKRLPTPPAPVAAPEPLPGPPHARPARVPAPPPLGRSKAWVAAVLVSFLAAGVVGGYVGGRMIAPRRGSSAGPCTGSELVSSVFGYCMAVPEGWQATMTRTPDGLDVFTHQESAVEVVVDAELLPEGIGLADAVDDLQAQAASAGLQVRSTRIGYLGGAPSYVWETLDPEGKLVSREIVAGRGSVIWKLRIIVSRSGEATDVSEADELLETWRFA